MNQNKSIDSTDRHTVFSVFAVATVSGASFYLTVAVVFLVSDKTFLFSPFRLIAPTKLLLGASMLLFLTAVSAYLHWMVIRGKQFQLSPAGRRGALVALALLAVGGSAFTMVNLGKSNDSFLRHEERFQLRTIGIAHVLASHHPTKSDLDEIEAGLPPEIQAVSQRAIFCANMVTIGSLIALAVLSRSWWFNGSLNSNPSARA